MVARVRLLEWRRWKVTIRIIREDEWQQMARQSGAVERLRGNLVRLFSKGVTFSFGNSHS